MAGYTSKSKPPKVKVGRTQRKILNTVRGNPGISIQGVATKIEGQKASRGSDRSGQIRQTINSMASRGGLNVTGRPGKLSTPKKRRVKKGK